MKSLLTRLQSYFKESYGGRYFEHVVKELSVDAPEIITSIFPDLRFTLESHSVKTEYHFCCNGRDRQADIAVIDNTTGMLSGLAEVKYDDHLKDSNGAQLEDYITFAKELKIPFVYITQYYPPEEHYTLVVRAGFKHVLFSDFGEKVKECTDRRTAPVRNLLVNYLKDKGYMFTNIDEDSLWKFMVRVFNAPRGHGRMRSTTDMAENIPSVFSGIMNNMYVLNTEISRKISPVLPVPKVDMSFRPKIEIEVEELTELIVNSKKNRKENVEIFADRENYKAGGVLWIFGESCICHSGENQPWVYFDYGFGFSIKPKDKEVKKVVYAQVSASNIKWLYFEKDINDTQLSCKAYLIKIFSELLLDTFAQAAKNSEISCARERFLKVIKKLKA